MDHDKLVFQSMNDFLQWKSQTEEETRSFYTSFRCVNKQNVKYQYYECCRSGIYIPRGNGIRNIKSQKSAKIGKRCPARIIARITEAKVFVKFYKYHEGHDFDLEHLRLSKNFRADLARRLKEGIHPKKVLDDVREKAIVENNFGRESLLTRRDLRNIKRCFFGKKPRHKLDADSVKPRIERIESLSDKNTPVLIHNEHDKEDEYGFLEDQDIQADDSMINEADCIGDALTEDRLKEEGVFPATMCLPQLGIHQGRKSSVVNKMYACIENYSNSSVSDEDNIRIHKWLDEVLAICAKSKKDHPEVSSINKKRNIETQPLSLLAKKKIKNSTNLQNNSTFKDSGTIEESMLGTEPIVHNRIFDHSY